VRVECGSERTEVAVSTKSVKVGRNARKKAFRKEVGVVSEEII